MFSSKKDNDCCFSCHLPTPSAVEVHLPAACCCLHANWAIIQQAAHTGPVCIICGVGKMKGDGGPCFGRNQVAAEPLLVLLQSMYITWAKSFVLLSPQIRRNRLMLACSDGWESCSIQAWQHAFMRREWEAAELWARDSPPRAICQMSDTRGLSWAMASAPPASLLHTILPVLVPWSSAGKWWSLALKTTRGGSCLHPPRGTDVVLPGLLGLTEHEPKDSINLRSLRLLSEMPGKSAEDIYKNIA